MSNLKAVILAAGKGTRMKSDLPKVLHCVGGVPMAKRVGDEAMKTGAESVCFVVGYGREKVEEALAGDGISFVYQEEQLGTGHAVRCAEDYIGTEGDVMILCGDTPLVRAQTLGKAVEFHRSQGNGVTVLSAMVDDPSGYGRIVRDDDGAFVRSVEDKDASENEKKIKEINSGIYVFEAKALKESLGLLNNDNAQGEYYLPDTLEIIMKKGGKAGAYVIDDLSEIFGVNDREHLAMAEDMLAKREGK
ncbi:MAG: NTP transferase domain-containing protein [Eubacterium sp.]|nr:NTP transferase domain-containing protein [Eubacterium sp.]